MRLGTADAESILRRFTKNNVQHPTYKALCELGKALKTVFLCDYLRLESLRREIHEGLQVIENWNSANDFILYGKGGEFATNRLDSPLKWQHINPYGTFTLNMSERLPLA